MKGRKERISLEQYLHFFHSEKQNHITANFLNQIISMHGFKKINNVPKKVLTEAVETLNLVNLSRSTVRDNGVSPCAFISFEDIIADLDELNWQDCCTTSIQTLNFSLNHQSSANRSVIPNSDSAADGSLNRGGASKKVSRKRKKGPGSGVSGDFGSSSSCLVPFESA